MGTTMTKLSIERTPLIIAAEINMINQQTKKALLTGAVEIGKRLKEAKALVPHGEWVSRRKTTSKKSWMRKTAKSPN